MEAAPLLKIQLRRTPDGSHGLGLSCTLGTIWRHLRPLADTRLDRDRARTNE
jgi:hypothetical protein